MVLKLVAEVSETILQKGLKSVFEIMGLAEDEINLKFGHMIEALGYGAPPHGGIAPGIDRLLTCITGETSIREVIAMPMTSSGRTAIMKAPSSRQRGKT